MFLYQIVNQVNGKKYYGITNDPKKRLHTHKHCWRSGKKTPLYSSIRKYGEDNFKLEVVAEGTDEVIAALEVNCIANDPTCYNLHKGGHIGFSMTKHGKTPEEIKEWRAKLSKSRQGKTPALGMKHTDETKKLCGEYGKLRWDIYGRYPEEVLDYSFIQANKKFGISKTHYYRLRKAATK